MSKGVVEKLNTPKIKDYTYVVMFLFIMSFFALVVIRPVLAIAFSLQKEAVELKEINKVYDDNIVSVIGLQNDLEKVRTKLVYLDQAVPAQPALQEVVTSIRAICARNGVTLHTLAIEPVSIQDGEEESLKLQEVKFDVGLSGEFAAVDRVMREILAQRRLKELTSIKMVKEKNTQTGDDFMRLILKVESFYL